VPNGASEPFTVDGLTIALGSGVPKAGDCFLIQPTRQGAADFAVTVTDPGKIAAAAPIRTSASQSNLGSASISAGKVLNVTDPNLHQAVEIRFTDPTTFDLIDTATHTTLAAGQTYTSGNPIAVNGWEVRISGIPQTGDSFQVTANAGGVGDNSNALALAGLQSSQTLLNGTSNYQSLYTQLIAEVGAHGNRAESTLKAQQALLDQTTQARDAASGVNLDEEAADLLRFQQAYAAAAQVIRVADSLFQTLLDAAKG
jgi:flagellar hook-associated protein 1 FlgK